jgi:hypothetical protein
MGGECAYVILVVVVSTSDKLLRVKYFKGRWHFVLCGILADSLSEGVTNLQLDGKFQGMLTVKIPLGYAMQLVGSEYK